MSEDKYGDAAVEALSEVAPKTSGEAPIADTCPLSTEELDDVVKGTMLASLAITDDDEETLKKIGKANPWHIEALRMITGSTDQAHKPLSKILEEDMGGLILDKLIDVNGITKGGHFLDTQGYIAHNDDTIVLSYRCTTSAFDWLTNLNTTSSEWEIAEDLAQGFSGYCSGLEGLCCSPDEHKPRVHTGFYNNFLASLPLVKEIIEPLLAPDQPPRTLFVVGHSLGAAVASLAGCYFLLEHDWTMLPHKFVHLTAGSPRSCCESMAEVVRARLTDQRAGNGQVQFYRVVKGRDLVTKVPPRALGFVHIIDPIKIMDDGSVVWRIKSKDKPTSMSRSAMYVDDDDADGAEEMKTLVMPTNVFGSAQDDDDGSTNTENVKYKKIVKKIPKAFRDHMPDQILRPIFKTRGLRYGSQRPEVAQKSLSTSSSTSDEESEQEKEEETTENVTDTESVADTEDVTAKEEPEKEVKSVPKRKWSLFGRKRKSKKESAQ